MKDVKLVVVNAANCSVSSWTPSAAPQRASPPRNGWTRAPRRCHAAASCGSPMRTHSLLGGRVTSALPDALM